MPSSFSFLLNSQSHDSSSSLESDLKSDQSEEDEKGQDDNRSKIGRNKIRTIQNNENILERPSDSDEICSQSDDSDYDDEKENDLFIPSSNPQLLFVNRQLTLYENDWSKKNLRDENEFKKSFHRGEATLLDDEEDDVLSISSNQHQLVSVFYFKRLERLLLFPKNFHYKIDKKPIN